MGKYNSLTSFTTEKEVLCFGTKRPERLLATLVVLVSIVVSATAQSSSPQAMTVEVRLQMSWWTKPSHRSQRETTATLEPLGSQGPAQTVRITDTEPSVVRLTPGRYQLTTTAPLVVNGQAYGWSLELPLFEPVNTVNLTQENAVRLSLGDVVETRNSRAKTVQTNARQSQLDPEARMELTALLKKWTHSIRSRDLNTLMSCYAMRLARYLDEDNVPRQQVQAQKEKLLHLYSRVVRFDLSNLQWTSENGRVKATAIKDWNFSNEEASWWGQSLVYFEFERQNSRWVITSERERAIPQRSVAPSQSAAISIQH